MTMSRSSRGAWLVAIPALFVLLWSTGFIGAKLGLPYAEPFTFLGIRMLIAAGLLLAFALLTRAPWPRDWRAAAHIATAGLLVHAVYLGRGVQRHSRGPPGRDRGPDRGDPAAADRGDGRLVAIGVVLINAPARRHR